MSFGNVSVAFLAQHGQSDGNHLISRNRPG